MGTLKIFNIRQKSKKPKPFLSQQLDEPLIKFNERKKEGRHKLLKRRVNGNFTTKYMKINGTIR